MTKRATDDPDVKPVRTYPSWAVIVTVTTWIFTAGVLYNGMQELTKATARLDGAVAALTAQVAGKDIKDAQHDTRLDEHDRRLAELGARISILEARR